MRKSRIRNCAVAWFERRIFWPLCTLPVNDNVALAEVGCVFCSIMLDHALESICFTLRLTFRAMEQLAAEFIRVCLDLVVKKKLLESAVLREEAIAGVDGLGS